MHADEMNIPYIPLEVVEVLERHFPDRCPTLGMTDREVWVSVGGADAARWARRVYEEQQG